MTTLSLHTIDGSRIGDYQLNFNGAGTALTLDLVSANVWFGGKLLREGDWNVVQDSLGSVRWRQLAVSLYTVEKADYYPFGQEKPSATTHGRQKFGTYLRDEVTGLDYADQRYYANTLGRFMTADPYRASGGPGDPGSWNRYSYVEGDPANFRDSRGLWKECPTHDGCPAPPPTPQNPAPGTSPLEGDCALFPDAPICQPPAPENPWDEAGNLTGMLRQRSRQILEQFDSNCQSAFLDAGYDIVNSLPDVLNNTQFGAWGTMGTLSVGEVSGGVYNTSSQDLNSWCGINVACSLDYTNVIVLTSVWSNASDGMRDETLLHELIHKIIGSDFGSDSQIADLFHLQYNSGANNGEKEANASRAWDRWLRNGCTGN